jgi:hypothetical protein
MKPSKEQIKKFWEKIFCLLHHHKWYYPEHTEFRLRQCIVCRKMQAWNASQGKFS